MTFDERAAAADKDSHAFTYNVRRLQTDATTRAQLRRVEAMIASCRMALDDFSERQPLLMQTVKD